MESLQARIDSFSKSKRVKNPSKPSSSVAVKWPHPPTFRASPEALAEAGFYFNPSFEDRDNVTCFACEKQLGNWEKDDDPFDIHWEKRGLTCCWASVRCGLREDMDRTGRFTFPDKTRLPTSKVMEKARLDTFNTGDGWIHDQVKNHGASSKKLARAGFTYTPQYPGDDLATCLYCNVSLSGWDAEDDPMEEHRKREKRSGVVCPFFLIDTPPKQPSKPTSRSQSTKPPSRSTSKSKHQDVIMPTKTHDGDSDASEPESTISIATTLTAKGKTPRKARSTSAGAKTPKTQGRSSSRSGTAFESEAEEVQETKKGRSRSKSVARDMSEAEEERIVPAPKKGRSRSKSVAREISEAEEEEAATAPKKKGKSRPKSVAKSEAEEEVEASLEPKAKGQSRSRSVARSAAAYPEDEEVPVRKASRSKSKSRAAEESEMDGVPRKSSRTKRPTMVLEEQEDEEEQPVPLPQKPTRTRSKAKVVENEPDPQPESEPEPKPAPVKQHTRKPSKSSAKAKATSRASSRTMSKSVAVPADDTDMVETEVEFKSESEPETEAELPPAPPPRKRQTLVKSKPPSPSPPPVDDENDEVGGYVPPPSSPPPPPPPVKHVEQELQPLFVPKRGTKKPVEPVVLDEEPVKATSKPAPVPEQSDREEDEVEAEVSPPTSAVVVPLVKEKTKAPGKSTPQVIEKRTKDVGVSSDEGEVVPEAVVDVKVKTKTPAKEDTTKAKPASKPQVPTLPKAKFKPAKPQKKAVVPPESVQHVPVIRKPSPGVQVDVDAEMIAADDHDPQHDVSMHDIAPSTPRASPPALAQAPLPVNPAAPTSLSLAPPAVMPSTEPTAPIPAMIPPLSKLPFTPLHSLTEAELDMTVEEWIRYQMEVEYDKFRRDGERELQRFRKRAEEVRVIIEGL